MAFPRVRNKTRWVAVALLVVYLLLGTGMAWIEDWSLPTGLYYAMEALTTVGFGDVVPETSAGRALTAVLVPLGILLAFGVGMMIVQERVRELMTTRRFTVIPKNLSGHFIVCGYGNIGAVVVRGLKQLGRDVCVVEADADKTEALEAAGVYYVIADAMASASLLDARVQHARSLITTFDDDSHNVYVVLEARELCKDVEIIATASSADAGRKMVLAGARRMVSPQAMAGEMLARFAVNPDVMEMFGEASRGAVNEQTISQVVISSRSWVDGLQLREVGQRLPGVRVAVAKKGDRIELAPPGSFRLEEGMVLMVVGESKAVAQLEGLVAP